MTGSRWVLLSYRLPRDPSTPRIALWRRLKRLGVVQLLDGLVALPLDGRTREQLEWLAGEVEEAGGDAAIWIGEPGLAAQQRALAARMQAAVADEYQEVGREAREALAVEPVQRKRTLARLRRQLWRIRRRDYFPPAAEREAARSAVDELGQSLEEVVA